MLEAVHEIAIYIHRFHNLELFQQGWYQIKITIRWEDEDSGYLGIPVRVVQYEAPDLGSDDVHGFWRIDDANHSFSTQPFRIRYTRQDVILSMMVTFNLTPRKIERKTLDSFKNVILLSSPQDGYVPYHSARIDACPASLGDPSQNGKIFQEMLNECLDQLRSRSCHEQRVLMRCDVDFDVSTQGKSLDTITGRAAHIEFLDSDIFVRLIMWSSPELFR